MRILRLSLENWRGVASREFEFGNGVTLIEGPNEIGKSSIVEALRMLFLELDSSKKKEVKSIQPVDQDVGSRVEAEVEAGTCHFVYSKTYNKSTQTTLNILAPEKRQLTGREAHERVEQILAQTVDMALWEALLVDQGDKVGLANLQNSAGLARALDAAAGNTGEADPTEESSLVVAVRAEYERYYTEKTGRAKYSNLQETFEKAEAELVSAQVALAEVEENIERHRGQSAEVRRLSAVLPDLQKSLKTREATWQSVRSLTEKIGGKRKEMELAQTIQIDAERALQKRRGLVTEVKANAKLLEDERTRQAPLTTQTQVLKAEIAAIGLEVTSRKKAVRVTRSRLELIQNDAAHLDNLDKLADLKKRLAQLDEITGQLKAQLLIRSEIKVDDTALDQIRQAVGILDIARSKRDAASTTVCVTAIQPLDFEIEGDAVSLSAAETTTRAVSAELEVHLPDIARIRVTPSASVAELADETVEAESSLAALKSRFNIESLEAAVAANQRRTDAERSIDQLKAREQEILQSSTREELSMMAERLKGECEIYRGERLSDTPLPESVTAARNHLADTKADLSATDAALDDAQEKVDRLTEEHARLDGQLRIAQQELAGLESAFKDRRTALDRAREERSDELLEARAKQATVAAQTLAENFSALETTLADSSPEAAQALVENARAVLDRARSGLADAEKDLAVLTDRLEQAQANGRFEDVELAERKFETAESALATTVRRALAAERLWSTLNRHREAAREAYAQPLKAAIESLGTIVFGPGFAVGISDDWSILTRTHQGKTLAFGDLSIGAKEQLGILVRLAAAQIVSKQGGVPLIIDDALGFSDPLRLETMGAAIAAAGRHCQVIILTCTPGRFTHVGNANVIRID